MLPSLSRGSARFGLGLALAVLATLAGAGATAVSAPAAKQTYVVQLADAPLALCAGGVPGLAPTMPAARGLTRLDPQSPASVQYLSSLTSRQNAAKLAFLGAGAAGVFASVSAGNDGPGSATIGSPSDSPWVLSVGAATHDRNLASRLTDMAGGAAAPPASIAGKSAAGGVGPAPTVYAGAYDATGTEPRHRFGAAGTHTLTLRVTDPSGLSNVTSKQITVKHDDDGGDD